MGTTSLPARGWRKKKDAPNWSDTKSQMRTFSIRAVAGAEVSLPALTGDAIFIVVVRDITSSPERLTEEVKISFRSWDQNSKGGIRREDMDGLLALACPSLDAAGRAALLTEADPRGTGKV